MAQPDEVGFSGTLGIFEKLRAINGVDKFSDEFRVFSHMWIKVEES